MSVSNVPVVPERPSVPQLPVIDPTRRRRPLADNRTDQDARIGHMIQASILLTMATVIGFIGWSMVAEIDEIAVSIGEIVPSGTVQAIQHLEGGAIAEVYVTEGQVVEKGQPLVRFDAAQPEAERARILSRRAMLALQAERLRAFVNGREPRWDVAGDADSGQAADQRHLYEAQVEARRTQIQVLERQIAAKDSVKTTAEASRRMLLAQLELLRDEKAVREDLFRRELNSRQPLLSARMQVATSEAELRRLEGQIETTQEEIEELRSRISDARAQSQREAYDRLNQTEAELAELGKSLAALDDRVSRLIVTAPMRGIMQELAVKTAGQVTQPGAIVGRLVPMDDILLAETRVSTRDIGFIKPEQRAKIKIGTYDFTRFGIINGTVTSLSATTFLDESRVPYYKARIQLDTNYVGHEPGKHLLLPGMTVQADIATGTKTVFQYILKPIYTTLDSAFRER